MNTLSAIGVTAPNLTANSVIRSMQFHDPTNNLNFPILPSPFDPSRPENKTMKQYYKWYFLQHLSVSLGMCKHVYKDYQKSICDKAATTIVTYPPYKLILVTIASTVIANLEHPNLVSEVLSRIYSGDGDLRSSSGHWLNCFGFFIPSTGYSFKNTYIPPPNNVPLTSMPPTLSSLISSTSVAAFPSMTPATTRDPHNTRRQDQITQSDRGLITATDPQTVPLTKGAVQRPTSKRCVTGSEQPSTKWPKPTPAAQAEPDPDGEPEVIPSESEEEDVNADDSQPPEAKLTGCQLRTGASV
ncbi:uncharacterized protein STEHIDRAFT_161526 [Stereum hirsutum FP-91666 SS1]|uniref:uncharacterized protein n=1 Tax=Stereum hirsutum (strain FP-91666) TaxID=721885 RepID=UPI00044495E6|nr:uncharacterized protein STEHIDRAFT_161526 [Stereum hirsutum FP-91666 SS1]EIM82185.1 hypothetical protein STEHIDRAFT_161526 [Stereum hirsutum FP-91666 SS1]